MTAETIATVVTALLFIVGCLGIVVPVLPGSIVALLGLEEDLDGADAGLAAGAHSLTRPR